ncbi:MAG: hypothetical protein AAFY36_08875 [Bacteroidota bacterium]
MKSFLLTSLLLVTLLFSCGNDDDNDGASMDLTTDIVGTYSNLLYITDIDDEIESVGGARVAVTKVSDNQISVNVSFPNDPDLIPASFTANMTSASALTVPSFSLFGLTTTGTGSFTNNTLVIDLTDSDGDTYKFTNDFTTLFVGSYSGEYEVSSLTNPMLFAGISATATKVSNTQFDLAFDDPDVGTFTLSATVVADSSAGVNDGTDYEVAQIVIGGATFTGDGFITPSDGFFKLNLDGNGGQFEQYFGDKQ